jgi:hypothetical protein
MTDLSHRRVPVVEDEAAIALDLARILREHGAIVIGPVSRADEAIAYIAVTKIRGARAVRKGRSTALRGRQNGGRDRQW